MADREQRLVENERFIREANLEIERDARDSLGGEPFGADDYELELFCACGRPDCDDKVMITIREYELAHAQPHRFVICPGHANTDVERVVERHDSYEVVEKLPAFQRADPTAL